MASGAQDLIFQGGYVGLPTPPDQTGIGFPDGRNVVPAFGGRALEQLPGYWRTHLARLWNGTPASEIQVFEVPPAAMNQTSGRVIALVDGLNGRVLSFAHISGGIPYSGSSATKLGTIRRHGPHDYPSVFSFKGKAIITSAWDYPRIYDGQVLRPMGLPTPRIRPVFGYARDSSDNGTVLHACDAAWTAVTQSGGDNLTCDTDTTNKTEGTASAKFTFGDDVRVDSTKFLARVNMAGAGVSLTAANKHVQFYIQNRHPTRTIPPKHLKFWIGGTASNDNTSTVITVGSVTAAWELDYELPPRQWVKVNLPLDLSGSATAMQIGINLAKRLPAYLNDGGVSTFDILIDDVRFFASASPVGTLQSGTYRVCYAWYSSKYDLESQPSPVSDPLVDSPGRSRRNFNIDVSGFQPQMQAGLANTTEVDTNGRYNGIIDRVRIYIARPGFGTDEFGRLNFRLLMEKAIPTLGSDLEASIDFLGEKSEVDVIQDRTPNWYGGAPPAFRQMIPFADRLIGIGQFDYLVGEIGVTQYSHVVTPVAGAGLADTPVFGPWMEGMILRVGSSAQEYTILKALDTDGDGDYDALWIGQLDTQAIRYSNIPHATFSVPFQESTDTDTTYRIRPAYNGVAYSHVGVERGIQIEQWPVLNVEPLEMENDQVTAGFALGNTLIVTGRRHVYSIFPNQTSRDDFVDTLPFLYRPQKIESQRGVSAWRSFARVSDQNAIALGTNGELLSFTAGAVQPIPLSRNVKGFLNDSSEVSRTLREFAHAAYVPENDWWALFLIEGDGTEPASPVEYGSTQSQDSVTLDFDRVVIVDLNQESPEIGAIMLLANDFPITCTSVSASATTTGNSYTAALYCGDVQGYLSQLFTPNAYGLGPPMRKIRGWTISATGTSTITVDANDGDTLPNTSTALAHLEITLFKSDGSGFEKAAARISSHTTSVLTLADTLANAFSTLTPEAGDTIGFGVQTHYVRAKEDRFRDKNSVVDAEINLFNNGVDEPDPCVYMRVYIPSSGKRYLSSADAATVDVQRRITESMIKSGQGIVPINSVAGHSLSVGIMWMSYGDAEFFVGPIRNRMSLHAADVKKLQGVA